jgi:hypothetical protein
MDKAAKGVRLQGQIAELVKRRHQGTQMEARSFTAVCLFIVVASIVSPAQTSDWNGHFSAADYAE